MTTYIKASFNGTTTEIKLGKSVSRKISVHRGVKQGDPLSPILFNAVMDKLLCQLSSLGRGGSLDKDGQIKCPTAASADDIVVFEDQDKHLPLDLALIYAFLAKRGMKLNSGKCSLISGGLVPRAGKIIPRAKPFLNYGGADIRMITDFERAKYLGHQLGASGIRKPTIMNLQKWLNNIARALLKHDQKLAAIKTYVIPKLLYGLQQPKITGKILREADMLTRYHIKKILHLNVQTPNSALYAKIKDGGLGLINLKGSIPEIFLKRLSRASLSLQRSTNLPKKEAKSCLIGEAEHLLKVVPIVERQGRELSYAWRAANGLLWWHGVPNEALKETTAGYMAELQNDFLRWGYFPKC